MTNCDPLTAVTVSPPRPCCTFSARLFMPQRMSVTPPAIHTFAPAGKAIMTHPGSAATVQGRPDQARTESSDDDRSGGRSRSSCRLQAGAARPSRTMLQPAAKSKAARSLLAPKRSEARFDTDDAKPSTRTAIIHTAGLSPNPAESLAEFPLRPRPSLRPTNPDSDQDHRRTRPQWGKSL